ncbi:hypothetical protein V1511DRAFT_457746 [Dipodascopsis uninucleata]
MQRTFRSVRSTSISFQARSLHSSSTTPTPSPALNKGSSSYKNLTVDNLRAECRKRGLKVSGKKSHLVDRLIIDDNALFSTSSTAFARRASKMPNISKTLPSKTTMEQTIFENKFNKAVPTHNSISEVVRAINTTPVVKAKDDDSTIDFYKMPIVGFKETPSPISIVSIPIVPTNFEVRSSSPSEYVSSRPEISHVSGDNVAGPILDTVDNSSVSEANSNEYASQDELQSRDKVLLTSFVACTLVWWTIGSLFEEKEAH